MYSKEKSTARSREDCIELQKIVDLISQQNPLQKKRINAFLNKQDASYWRFAEDLSVILNRSFLVDVASRKNAAKSYNKMCMDFLKEQIQFKKTGTYSVQDAAVANSEVYSDPIVMRYYMVGLLVSYLFWPNHYQLFQFFKKHLPPKNICNYLEVGVGHGLFTSTLLSHKPALEGTLIDISAVSIKTAMEVFDTFQVDQSKLRFINEDYLTAGFEGNQFQFIIMGEVLEHVNDAPAFMKKTKSLLAEDGSIYISTCANSPAIDHVYHFHNIKEIQDLLRSTGFEIVEDLSLAAEAVSPEDWEKELVTVNYCALLQHA
jgi:2-polyprenyl-3-methyl-5-hydroxy-6-metoxy-1,4-benzoquinol methylase